MISRQSNGYNVVVWNRYLGALQGLDRSAALWVAEGLAMQWISATSDTREMLTGLELLSWVTEERAFCQIKIAA